MSGFLYSTLSTFIVLIFVLVIGRTAFGAQARFLEGYSIGEQAFDRDNSAVLIRISGAILALLCATVGAYHPGGLSVLDDLGYGTAALVGALVALIVSRYLNDHYILANVDNNKEVVQERNVAVAIVEFSTYLATAFIFVGGMLDRTHGVLYNALWFAFGQVFLVALAQIYRRIDSSVFEEIEKGNPACALSLAGLLAAGGLAVSFAIRGSSNSVYDFANIALGLAVWALLIWSARVAMHFVLAPRARITSEITVDHNWAVGFFEGAVYVAVTAAFVSIHG